MIETFLNSANKVILRVNYSFNSLALNQYLSISEQARPIKCKLVFLFLPYLQKTGKLFSLVIVAIDELICEIILG